MFLMLAFLSAFFPASSSADSLEDAARNLAQGICTAARHQPVRINWQMSSELAGSSADSLKRALLSQLSACGAAANEKADIPVNVAVRVTVSKVVLISSLTESGGGPQIRITEFQRDLLSIPNESSRTLRPQKKLLWQQQKPLDAAMEWVDPSNQQRFLFLVSQGSFLRLRSTNESWSEMDSSELPKSDRSLRPGGRGATFVLNDPEAKPQVYIDRKLCDFDPQGRLSFSCNHTYQGGKLLGISSECGGPRRTIFSDSGDYTQKDRIHFGSPGMAETELPADEVSALSLEMPGPVLDISASNDSKAATAVVKNLSTGNYEVYRITLPCGT